jgi:hypothetical protein
MEKGKMSQKREKNNEEGDEEGGDHYPASLGESIIPSPMPAATFHTSILLENPSLISQVCIPATSSPPRIKQSSILTCPVPYIQPLLLRHFLPQTVIQLAPLTIDSLTSHFKPITALQWHRPYNDLVELCRLLI